MDNEDDGHHHSNHDNQTMDDDLEEYGGDADIGIDATDQAHADAKKEDHDDGHKDGDQR